ncbi:hypothetical protein CJ014_10130 [Pleomorphomonas carboxyditropha]|uniref:Arc-like DNA binding domain-containing protein n=2 Tax=Pleomorphomonas carboxyditropha TaxID=2023338 RepID=A0A2G9WZB5_9HYPH|nr:hypothetical protein CJ014_10130 [Pleomorphomonas carboxyditropha]
MCYVSRCFIARNSIVLYIEHMARDDLQVNVRIPADLKAALEAKANSNYRSLTGEIVARLWRTLEEDDLLNAVAGDVEDLKERVKNLEDERRIAYDGD